MAKASAHKRSRPSVPRAASAGVPLDLLIRQTSEKVTVNILKTHALQAEVVGLREEVRHLSAVCRKLIGLVAALVDDPDSRAFAKASADDLFFNRGGGDDKANLL